MEDLIKAKDLAKLLNVNVETVRRWTRSNTIPYAVIGKSKRYNLTKVMNALEIDGIERGTPEKTKDQDQ